MEKIIGVVTTEFGFGPVSKAVYIIDAINRLLPEAEVVFWGGGLLERICIGSRTEGNHTRKASTQ